MARNQPKTSEELALADKLDVARTVTRLRARIDVRHELNDLEAHIKQTHSEQVNKGKVARPALPAGHDLYDALGS